MLAVLKFLKTQVINIENIILSMNGQERNEIYNANIYFLTEGTCEPLEVFPSNLADKLS